MIPDTALHPLPEDALEQVHGGAGKISLPGTEQPATGADMVSMLLSMRPDNGDTQHQQIANAQSALHASLEETQNKLAEAAAKMQDALDKHSSVSMIDKIGMAFEQIGAIVQVFTAAQQLSGPHMPEGAMASVMNMAQQSLEALWEPLQPILEHPQMQQMLAQHGQEPGPYAFLQSFSEAMQDGHLSQPEMMHMFQSALPLFTGQGTGTPTVTVPGVGGISAGMGGSTSEVPSKHRG